MPNSIKDHLIDHERQDEICVGQQLLTTSQHSVKQPLQLGRLNGAESRQDWWRRDRFVGGTRPSGKMITQKQRSHGVKLSMLTFFFFTIFRETHAMFTQVGINCLVREFSECGLMCVTGEEWVIFMSCSGSVADLEVEWPLPSWQYYYSTLSLYLQLRW